MTVRQTAAIGIGFALLVCGTVLALLWRYGVWHFVKIGRIDLQAVLWPASEMLTVGWRSTLRGLSRTITAVTVNCVLYAGIALLLRSVIKLGHLRLSLLATCVSVVSTIVVWNTALVLTSRNYCIAVLTIPLTNKSVVVPQWLWGPIPLLIWAVSTVIAVVLWIKLFVVGRSEARHQPG